MIKKMRTFRRRVSKVTWAWKPNHADEEGKEWGGDEPADTGRTMRQGELGP